MSAMRRFWEEVTGLAQRKREAMEILHMAAERIRTAPPPADLDGRFGPYINGWLDGVQEAADLIDPEVDQ